MILLDTNVLSELMKPTPNKQVVSWLDKQSEWDMWISSITVAEIFLGISLLHDGKKKTMLFELAQQMFDEDFKGRCLPFDDQAAVEYAAIVSKRTRIGRPVSIEDAQIASISKTADLILATRNINVFMKLTD
ncbi:type II toxin-antitoxin system VapC family toxin [Desulfobacter hydrogenophilus]|uniref:type II toxin-antitoxin system VapC family toxin n=1 Tax=Desulfobacter hydrogenophilus TaxID=2291 RepID=UPI001F5EC06D|nr:type II toxin-antitoxin system VapC family toxin [Desulfobacter hydrogenophilus]